MQRGAEGAGVGLADGMDGNGMGVKGLVVEATEGMTAGGHASARGVVVGRSDSDEGDDGSQAFDIAGDVNMRT